MQSLSINQLVINGSAPLSYGSELVVHHLLDVNKSKKSSFNDQNKLSPCTVTSCLFESVLSLPFDDFSSINTILQEILDQSSFHNKNITLLLRSALFSGTASFRRALLDFKMMYPKKFIQELNQTDKHQNTLLWYLTIAGH